MVAVLAQLQLVPCTGPRMYQSSRWKHSYARRPQVVYTLLAKCSGIAKALVHQTPLPKGKLNFILLSRTSYSCHQKNSFMFRIFFPHTTKKTSWIFLQKFQVVSIFIAPDRAVDELRSRCSASASSAVGWWVGIPLEATRRAPDPVIYRATTPLIEVITIPVTRFR